MVYSNALVALIKPTIHKEHRPLYNIHTH